MAPRRKKSRTNSQAPDFQPGFPAAQNSKAPNGTPTEGEPKPADFEVTTAAIQGRNDPGSATSENTTTRSSWYGGSWRSKASPVAQVARESVSVAGGATSESSAEEVAKRPGPFMNNSFRKSRKSIPLAAEASRINATGSNTEGLRSQEKNKDGVKLQDTIQEETKAVPEMPSSNPPLPPDPSMDSSTDGSQDTRQTQADNGWFGWWSRPDGYAADGEKAKDVPKIPEVVATDAQETPLPLSPQTSRSLPTLKTGPEITLDTVAGLTTPGKAGSTNGSAHSESTLMSKPVNYGSTRSWFGLWSATQNEQAQQEQPLPETQSKGEDTATLDVPKTDAAKSASQVERIPEQPTKAEHDESPPRPSGWAFWLKDAPKAQAPSDDEQPQKQVGELAVADTPSQSHPEAAQFNEERQQKSKRKSKASNKKISDKEAKGTKESQSAKDTKDANDLKAVKDVSDSKDIKVIKDPKNGKDVKDSKGAKDVKDAKTATESKSTKKAEATHASGTESATQVTSSASESSKPRQIEPIAPAKPSRIPQTRPNLVIPSFYDTYPTVHVPTYWEQLGQYLASSLRLADMPQSPSHVTINTALPKVRNAIAIGVHGYFPAPLIQKVLGQPTGTSIRFANYAAAAIRSWTDKHQPETPCEVEQVALEGEGYIADRVTTLWKLMLNWLSHLRNADLIYVACHSQGVPVAIMLVAKLIQLGCLSPTAKVGICAMAGVNLGPFLDYKSRFFGGSAAELFEFSKPDSKVSKEYASSLEVVLRHGVRVTYVGSIDDQLVSLESSLFSNLTHPYVQRAVFVDGRLHTPDFISHLVSFALRLRNLGISDHGLIRELSHPLAGSIYGGEGHSRVYDDAAVYELALAFALETTDIDPRTVIVPVNGAEPSEKEGRKTSEERKRSTSTSGIPSSTLIANNIRRGNASAAFLPGIAPQIVPYEVPATGGTANPYFLPWAMRGILEEEVVKRDMQEQVTELVNLFEDWRPASKPLRDVRFRLEAVKSKL